MLRIAQTLEAQLRAAMQQAFPEADDELNPALGPASKPEFGDFQANGALALAKPLKQAPRQIAAAIVEHCRTTQRFQPWRRRQRSPARGSSTSPLSLIHI